MARWLDPAKYQVSDSIHFFTSATLSSYCPKVAQSNVPCHVVVRLTRQGHRRESRSACIGATVKAKTIPCVGLTPFLMRVAQFSTKEYLGKATFPIDHSCCRTRLGCASCLWKTTS